MSGAVLLRWRLADAYPHPHEVLCAEVGSDASQTVVPGEATPVQVAQDDSALRSAAFQAATGLPDPWPALARRAAIANESELADRLDQAVAGADLRMAAGPRWWGAARWLQRTLAAVALAGVLWLAVLAGLGYLQLGDAVPTPDVQGLPIPTVLLVGGLLAGVLLATLARLVNRSGARRRARRARRTLDQRVEHVADELVIAPLERELAAHTALLRALDSEPRPGLRRLRSAPDPVPT